MNNKILNRDEFLTKLSHIELSKFACLLSINDNAFEIAKAISEKSKLPIYRLDKLKKNQEELHDFNIIHSSNTLLIVSDVSASGKTLDDAKSLLDTSITAKTFAISGKADYFITDEIICSTKVVCLNPISKVSFLKKVGLFTLGFGALTWVLLRTGLNPKRASYPCQQAAMPFALIFLGYITSLFGLTWSIKNAKEYFNKKRLILGFAFSFVAILAYAIFASINTSEALAAYTPPDGANKPMGTAKGIFPGRVVWAYNPDATNWVKGQGYFWSDASSNQSVIDNMMSQTIRQIAGQSTDAAAWSSIFRYFNNSYGKGNVGYVAGEKVAIKINLNCTRDASGEIHNHINPTPDAVLSIVKQLILNAGVAQGDIVVYDASRHIADNVYTKIHNSYPNVQFVDGYGDPGRIKNIMVPNVIKYAQQNYCGTGIAKCAFDAQYIVNMAILKAHPMAGVTLMAKNHYGTISGLDHTLILPDQHGMDDYHPFVEYMGDKDLGGKTLINIIDGLYGAFHSETDPELWKMAPFNNDWPSSIFVSLDAVAISSVGLDFLRYEMDANRNNSFQPYSDHDLHEMALCDKAPSGVKYDPNGTGSLASLGVHEHWNNATDKRYSRNLGNGSGIELIYIRDNNTTPNVTISSPTNNAVFAVGANVTINASASDADGTIKSVAFFRDGNLISTSTQAPYSFTITNIQLGTYSLTAVATDDKDLKGSSLPIIIKVNDPNAAPLANAGVDKIIYLPATSTELDGSLSADPNNKSLTYKWTQISGPKTSTIGNSTSAKANISGLVVGNFVFQLEINNGSKTSSDRTEVNVFEARPLNVALLKPVTVGAIEGAYGGASAVDGNLGTRWSSTAVDPITFEVDLQAEYLISQIILRWEAASGKAYKIEISKDKSIWNPLYSTTTGDGGVDDLAVSGIGRYIKFTGTQRNTIYGYSLWEFEAYGNLAIPTILSEVSNKQLEIYPNPVMGNQITISTNKFDRENYLIDIADLSGNILLHTAIESVTGVMIIDLPREIQKGIFIVKITNGKQTTTRKIIKL